MTGSRTSTGAHVNRNVLFIPLAFAAGARGMPAQQAPACSPPQQHAASAAPQHLSQRARREVFEKVWRDIRDHYYDSSFNGVNWVDVHTRYRPLIEVAKDDQQFYSLMSQMTGELHDAHTRFNSPEQWRNFKKQQGVGSGLSLDEIDGKVVVTAIRPDSNAAHVGIEPGMVLLTVDGKPVEERISEIESAKAASSTSRATRIFTYSRLLAGPTDTEV